MSLFEELKRRNVFRVGIAYAVLGWLLLQVTDIVVPILELPEWVAKLVLFLLLIGLPIVLFFAWAFELTPEGVKREKDIDRSQSIAPQTGKKLDRMIILVMGAVIAFLLLDRFYFAEKQDTVTPGQTPVVAEAEPKLAVAPSPTPAQEGATNSIAVLPFVNMSADADNEFFSDGISEEILNVLARVKELKVAARTSAFAYKGTNIKIAQIGQELGVNHVLEGSVRKAGNQVRVTAQLIQASDGFHLWSETYDRELDNIFAIQDEIAAAIADALKVSLGLETGAAGNLTGTQSIEAYEHYLQGMSLWHLRTVSSLEQAIREFEDAIELDPEFAKAHAGLALAWAVLPGYLMNTDQQKVYRYVNTAANRALELDPDNVEALISLGLIARYQFDWAKAKDLYHRAIALNPSSATAHQWFAGLLDDIGDLDASLVSYRKAWSLDPRSRIIGYNLAGRLSQSDRVEEAIALLDEVIGFAPEFPDAVSALFHLLLATGDCDRAEALGHKLAKILNKANDSTSLYLDLCLTGDPAKRAAAIATVLSWPSFDFAGKESPSLSYAYDINTLLVNLGEFDAALESLEKSADQDRTYEIIWLRTLETENGRLFRCDPRFIQITTEVGIPPPVKPLVCD